MDLRILKKLSVFISLLLLLNSFPANVYAGDDSVPGGFEKAAENARLALYANAATGEIAVENKVDGRWWRSNPADREDDTLARGVQKMNLYSQLLVECTDTENNASVANNYTGSIQNGPPAVEKIKDGIRFTFDFPSLKIKIPVQYTLGTDYLKAGVLTGQIEEYGAEKVMDISLLPYFGAGGLKDGGYIFVPDGSGALMNFNNGRSYYKPYEEPIYGRDNVLSAMFKKDKKENAKLPVFGIKNGDGAFLAIVVKGDFLGTVNTSVSGWKTSYNNVYCAFRYRAEDSTVLAAEDYSAKDVSKIESGHAKIESYEVRYYFLSGKEADYSGMAGRYRQFLVEEQGFGTSCRAGDIPFYLQLYGGVKVKKSVLGLPFNLVQPMTTYGQAVEILKKLRDGGVENIALRYTGWMNNGINDRLPSSAKPEGKLGGKKGFDGLRTFVDGSKGSVSLFPDVDLMNVHKTGIGFVKSADAARDVFDEPALQYKYKTSTFAKDTEARPWYLTSPNLLFDMFRRFLESFSKLEAGGISAGSMGSAVYSDFNRKKPMDRQQAGEVLGKSLELAKAQAVDILTDNAGIYALKDASHATGIPSCSNGLDVEDESIPFYPMVLHGLIPYSSGPENLGSDPRLRFLKNVETGAYPEYTWTWKDSSELKESDYNYLYSTKYSLWLDTAVSEYLELNRVLSPLADKQIVGHGKLSEGLYETVYSNGTRILVNYNEGSVEAEGRTVGGMDYSVINGGE